MAENPRLRSDAPALLVIGSLNHDSFVYVDRLPDRGQTVIARSAAAGLGGKGANQAIAAQRLGARVAFLGAVGGDAVGAASRDALVAEGIDVSMLRMIEGEVTGTAAITVEDSGENTIVVHSGANARVDPADITRLLDDASTRQFGLILVQGELSAAVVETASRLAEERGVRIVLNLAPVIEISYRALALADPLVVNKGEAEALISTLGIRMTVDTVSGMRDSVDEGVAYAESLAAALGTSVVITLGAAGVAAATIMRSWAEPSPVPDQVVDSTGAGDAFVGALCFALAGGEALEHAVRLAAAAGSFAVGAAGTVASYATAAQLDLAMGDPQFSSLLSGVLR